MPFNPDGETPWIVRVTTVRKFWGKPAGFARALLVRRAAVMPTQTHALRLPLLFVI